MNFFKEIRQKLLTQNALKKYMAYAIGEILLVMIGISLAFQLDNWNEDRILRKTEINYYVNIKNQIIDDQQLIGSQMEFNNRFLEAFRYANKLIEDNDKSKMDTLGLIIRDMTQYSDFDREGNIYESLVNSGEIKILQNQGIVQGIRELEERYMYINRMESIHYDAMMNHVVVIINSIIKYASAEVKKPELVFTYEFQNILVILMQIMAEKDEVYQAALKQIEYVKVLINSELQENM